MAKDKMNHRRKNKTDREYVPLDISQFDDIIKKPKPKFDKKKPYKGKKKYNPKVNKDDNKRPSDGKPRDNSTKSQQNRPQQNKPEETNQKD